MSFPPPVGANQGIIPGQAAPPNYKKAALYGLIATVAILGTTILGTLALGFTAACIFNITLMTLDGGFNALFAAASAEILGSLTWSCGEFAWKYCKKTHSELNP